MKGKGRQCGMFTSKNQNKTKKTPQTAKYPEGAPRDQDGGTNASGGIGRGWAASSLHVECSQHSSVPGAQGGPVTVPRPHQKGKVKLSQ